MSARPAYREPLPDLHYDESAACCKSCGRPLDERDEATADEQLCARCGDKPVRLWCVDCGAELSESRVRDRESYCYSCAARWDEGDRQDHARRDEVA